MSENKFGNKDVNMDLEYNNNYNLLLNFQKNMTDEDKHINELTRLQILNHSMAAINSSTNETYKEELLQWIYR